MTTSSESPPSLVRNYSSLFRSWLGLTSGVVSEQVFVTTVVVTVLVTVFVVCPSEKDSTTVLVVSPSAMSVMAELYALVNSPIEEDSSSIPRSIDLEKAFFNSSASPFRNTFHLPFTVVESCDSIH
jgi:diacylglycerol kinase